ncbi:MAG: S41 family peptidase [Defluviitaleaceae bacterium]|nr:S41 family peptidase [Defluviitaleaceae bacterium]
MKKLAFLVLFAIFALTACSNRQERQAFLDDLDYMIYVLETNFPLLEAANWAHGVDYRELAEAARGRISNMSGDCEDEFLAIMTYSFYPLYSTGHFAIFDHTLHYRMVSNFYGGYMGIKGLMNLELMLGAGFYEPSNLDRARRAGLAFRDLVQMYGEPFNRTWSDRIPRPFSAEIVEEGRIAYVSAGRDMSELGWAHSQIISFFREVADFEHIIIDMRGNGGGDINRFINAIMRPLLQESVESPTAFAFFFDAPYIRRFGELLLLPTISSGHLTNTEPYRPALEILETHHLPEINIFDIERFDYGVPIRTRTSYIRPDPIVNGFDGKIWMLTDGGMVSAAQLAAWYAKETGFATLVGCPTGGSFGGPRTMAFMPNTGIIFYFDMFYITDSRGRPLEAGTLPHHFNREGMDALATVLALIDEGNY